MKNLLEIVQNPRTLEQSFRSLKDTNIEIDEKEVRSYLFEYAMVISKIEKIDLNKSENHGFLEFMMRNHCSNLIENLIFHSCSFDSSKKYSWSPPNISAVISLYRASPLNTYNPIVFQKAKEYGIFTPNGIESVQKE